MIDLYNEMDLWVENDAYVPKLGDLILYDWEDSGIGDCTGAPNHIGIVVSVSGTQITVIEGNNNNYSGHPVSYRTISVNARYIRGYATPRYDVDNGITFVKNREIVGSETDETESLETQMIHAEPEPVSEEPEVIQEENETE